MILRRIPYFDFYPATSFDLDFPNQLSSNAISVVDSSRSFLGLREIEEGHVAGRSSGVKLLVRLTVSDDEDLAVVFKVLQNFLIWSSVLGQLILGQLNFFQIEKRLGQTNDTSSFKTRSIQRN